MLLFRQWRLDNGLSLQEVSDLTGVSISMVSRVERGQKRLSPRRKVMVARRLGVRLSDLFEIDDTTKADAA
ncbi:helix-turn-helix domain-containing protein [Microbispora bryophytorum]|uniref:helix-turn-helix domain-containing protein n=1 Tax=Microbispora bryophytorum TaxID=1460882 RepID=UPI00340C0E9F